MSTATINAAAGDFDDFEFEVLVADLHKPRRRAARGAEDRRAIDVSLGRRRHRSHEKEV
jgi:hypothetical protein